MSPSCKQRTRPPLSLLPLVLAFKLAQCDKLSSTHLVGLGRARHTEERCSLNASRMNERYLLLAMQWAENQGRRGLGSDPSPIYYVPLGKPLS